MTTAETWRVVCEGGEVRIPGVAPVGCGDYVAVTNERGDDNTGFGQSPRAAVLELARTAGWEAVEIVAPGAQTSAERLAQVTAERDAAVAQRDALTGAVRAYRAAEETMALVIADDHRRDTYHEWAKRHGAAMDAVDAAPVALDAALAAAGGV
jgi:hypothetical protein